MAIIVGYTSLADIKTSKQVGKSAQKHLWKQYMKYTADDSCSKALY